MNVYIFTWKHSQSNAFLFFILKLIFYFETYLFWTLLVVLRHPHQRARRVISDWMVLEVSTQERMLLEQTNQWLAPENPDESLETSNNSFPKIAPCMVSLVNVRIHKRFSSNFSQPTSIRPCTLRFRALQCSMERPGASPWQAHVAFESYSRRNRDWWTLARVMATIELSSRYESKSA